MEEDKKKFRDDKAEAEKLKYSNPTEYRRRMEVLERVQESIESKIDRVNERIGKVKAMEKSY